MRHPNIIVADYASQAVINALILENEPNANIVAEEDTSMIASNTVLQNQILSLIRENVASSNITSTGALIAAIDAGSFKGDSKGVFWTLDPIDGTKGFLRGGQYAVCLALISNGLPVISVLGCPNLKGGVLLETIRDSGVVKRYSLSDTTVGHIVERKRCDAIEWGKLVFCESVEAKHSAQNHQSLIATSLGVTKPGIRMDSQAKYASLVLGDSDIYLRLPTQHSYEEKIWDHAAGALLIREIGGETGDMNGDELDFGRGRTLKASKGVIAVGDKQLWSTVIQTVCDVVEQKALFPPSI